MTLTTISNTISKLDHRPFQERPEDLQAQHFDRLKVLIGTAAVRLGRASDQPPAGAPCGDCNLTADSGYVFFPDLAPGIEAAHLAQRAPAVMFASPLDERVKTAIKRKVPTQ